MPITIKKTRKILLITILPRPHLSLPIANKIFQLNFLLLTNNTIPIAISTIIKLLIGYIVFEKNIKDFCVRIKKFIG